MEHVGDFAVHQKCDPLEGFQARLIQRIFVLALHINANCTNVSVVNAVTVDWVLLVCASLLRQRVFLGVNITHRNSDQLLRCMCLKLSFHAGIAVDISEGLLWTTDVQPHKRTTTRPRDHARVHVHTQAFVRTRAQAQGRPPHTHMRTRRHTNSRKHLQMRPYTHANPYKHQCM